MALAAMKKIEIVLFSAFNIRISDDLQKSKQFMQKWFLLIPQFAKLPYYELTWQQIMWQFRVWRVNSAAILCLHAWKLVYSLQEDGWFASAGGRLHSLCSFSSCFLSQFFLCHPCFSLFPSPSTDSLQFVFVALPLYYTWVYKRSTNRWQSK